MPEPQRRPRKTPEQESLERLRRIETRITTLAIGLGVDMNTQKPVYEVASHDEVGCLTLPSINSSMKEILAAIPDDCSGIVDIYLGTDDAPVARIAVRDRT